MESIDFLPDDEKLATGRFTDITDSLLPLFADPDARAARRWRELFGYERPAAPKRGGIRFTVSVRRRSSSGS